VSQTGDELVKRIHRGLQDDFDEELELDWRTATTAMCPPMRQANAGAISASCSGCRASS
jgi:hypothetical protein